MDDRFRKLPPRIEPTYETEDVSNRPPTSEVRETSPWSPAGEVAAYVRFADDVIRAAPSVKARMHRVALMVLGAAVVAVLAMVTALLLFE